MVYRESPNYTEFQVQYYGTCKKQEKRLVLVTNGHPSGQVKNPTFLKRPVATGLQIWLYTETHGQGVIK